MRTTYPAGLVILPLAFSIPLFAQPGESGMAFLKLGISGRGVGMADAMSALVTGAAATHYNPAGLLPHPDGPLTSQIMFMHKEWIQDTRTEFLGGAIPLNHDNAIGGSINSTTVSDIELRTRPGPPEGTFTARNFSAGLSYAHRLTPEIGVGITGRFLYEKILIDEASGFALDVGGMWNTPVENLTVGAALSNLGEMSDLRNESTTLPALLRLGPAYAVRLIDTQISAVIGLDLLRILPEKRNYLNLGGEFIINRVISARGGYQFGSEGRGLSLGLGVQHGIIALDYAFAKIASDLGDGHTLSLAINL